MAISYLFRVKFLAGTRLLDQNVSKIHIFGVEFGADPRFLGQFGENVHFQIHFRQNSTLGNNLRDSFKKHTEFIAVQLKLLALTFGSQFGQPTGMSSQLLMSILVFQN